MNDLIIGCFKLKVIKLLRQLHEKSLEMPLEKDLKEEVS